MEGNVLGQRDCKWTSVMFQKPICLCMASFLHSSQILAVLVIHSHSLVVRGLGGIFGMRKLGGMPIERFFVCPSS